MISKPFQLLSKLMLWVTLGLLGLLLISALIIQFYLFPNVDQYKGYIAKKISEKTQMHADIGNIQVGWEALHPQLTVSEITLKDAQQDAVLQFKNTQAAISFFSLLQLSPVLSNLEITDPKLTVERTESGEILIAGISTAGNQKPTFTNWLLEQHRISVKNATITWLDRQRGAPAFNLNQFNLSLHNPRLLGLLDEHQLTITFVPSVGTRKPITLKGKLYGDSIAEIKDSRNHLSLQFGDTNLLAFHPWVDYPAQLKTAKGSATIGLFTNRLNIQSIDANLDLKQIRVSQPATGASTNLQHLNGHLEWAQYKEQNIVRLTNTRLKVDQHPLENLTAQYQYKTSDNSEHQLTVELPTLNLEILSVLNKLLPADHQVNTYLTALKPAGRLSDLSLSLKTKDQQLETLSLKTDFDRLSINAYEKIPGVSNLTGKIKTSKSSGNLTIKGEDIGLDLQAILREPLKKNQLEANINWKLDSKTTNIAIKKLNIKNLDLSGSLTGEIDLKPSGPLINLSGNFKKFEMTSVKRYLPRFLKPMTLRWLDNAFLAGTGHDTKLTFKGAGKQFPFVNANHQYDPNIGIFSVTSNIKNATVHYGKNWPDAENVNLTLAFTGPSLTLKSATGSIRDAKIDQANFVIPTLDTPDPHLEIKGDVIASVPQAIDFINNSPVHRVTQGFTDELTTEGNGKLKLTMDIPLKRSKETALEGIYTVTNGEMRSESIPDLSNINGQFRFTEDILEAKALTASAFDTDIKVDVKSGENKSILVSASGMASPVLFNHFVSNAGDYLVGESPFTTEIKIQKPNVDINIESTLAGISSYLPPPFNKVAETPWAMRINKLQSPERETWQLSLDTLVAGELTLKRQSNKKTLSSVHIAIDDSGTQQATMSETLVRLKQSALNLDADLKHLSLDDWKTVYQRMLPEDNQGTLGFSPRYEIHTDTMDVVGRRFNHVKITHSDVSGFVDIESDAVQGRLKWSKEGQGKLMARLAHFSIPEAAPAALKNPNPLLPESEETSTSLSQDDYPSIDLQSQQFILNGKDMGGLVLFASPKQGDWSIQRFSLYNDDSTLNATGTWKNAINTPETSLAFDWDIKDLGKMLARFGHPDSISKGDGIIKGTLNWPSSPHTFDLLNLNGDVSFKLESGEILQVKPGVGRLLGLVSLQSLPRRLTLDFSDLFSQGFAFDKISADLAINKGIMRSDNFKMSGPAADVQMQGETNLKEETQHLKVKVMPQISDSISLAALAGGPLAGAVAFLAQKVLKDPLNKVISTEYEITGTWDNPVEVKKAATAKQKQTGIQ